MNIKPYIGITGIKTVEESLALHSMTRRLKLPNSHSFMIGGLASYKGLRLGRVADTSQYVLPFELNDALIGDSKIMNIIHYNSRHDGLLEQIKDVLGVVEFADGIQLNIPWPNPDMLRTLREEIAPIVILQVSAAASEYFGHDPGRIVAKLSDYESVIDYALIDPSGGVGREFELDYTQTILTALVESKLGILWGIAGGLGQGRLDCLSPLLDVYPDLSWDAQARLRTKDCSALDLAACQQYLMEGVELLRKLPGRC